LGLLPSPRSSIRETFLCGHLCKSVAHTPFLSSRVSCPSWLNLAAACHLHIVYLRVRRWLTFEGWKFDVSRSLVLLISPWVSALRPRRIRIHESAFLDGIRGPRGLRELANQRHFPRLVFLTCRAVYTKSIFAQFGFLSSAV
jgi:hypothetical protein